MIYFLCIIIIGIFGVIYFVLDNENKRQNENITENINNNDDMTDLYPNYNEEAKNSQSMETSGQDGENINGNNGINGFKLSSCFRWIAGLNVLGGFILGAAEKDQYGNWLSFFTWIIIGVISCLFCLAIAKFLDAADKYLNEK